MTSICPQIEVLRGMFKISHINFSQFAQLGLTKHFGFKTILLTLGAWIKKKKRAETTPGEAKHLRPSKNSWFHVPELWIFPCYGF